MNLKLERVKRGLSQGELSKISKVGLTTIVKLEKGEINGVSVGILKKISKALGVSIVELFFSENEQ